MSKKKKKSITLTGLALGLVVLGLLLYLGVNTVINYKEKESDMLSDDYILAGELPALLSFTYYDTDEWQSRLKEKIKGKVSYGELEELLDQLGLEEYITYEEKSSWKQVKRADFFRIYDQILDILDVEKNVKTVDIVILGDSEKDNMWLTQRGYQTVRGGMEYFHQYDMYTVCLIEGEIAGIHGICKEPVMWENVFIHNAGEGVANILYEKEMINLPIEGLTDSITDTICDIEWKNSLVSAIYKKEDTIQGTILSYNKKQIEISGYGTLKHSGELKVYKTYGTVEQLDESKLVIGNLMAEFVVAEKKVCGIILKEPASVENIRVLLLNEESAAPYYPEVYLTADEEFTLTINDKEEKMETGALVKASGYWKEDSEGFIRIETATEQGNIYFSNENAEHTSYGYQGAFEIRKLEEGYSVVNELSLEDYLCAVVPSEMPASYETEALKAQAVCARSYACIQLAKGDYAGLGANVDDSTSYQVYNKQERNEKSSLAVNDTVGEVLIYQDNIAEAYYYSTSCGYSQGIGVWNLSNDGTYDYLEGVSLVTEDNNQDLTDEEVFADFIKNKEVDAFDSDAAYFRWRAELDISGNLKSINENIMGCKAANALNVEIYDVNGKEWDTQLSELGEFQQLKAEERESGGALKKIRLVYEKGSILLSNEYNIRKVLGAAVTSLSDKNDAAIQATGLLPSAVFCAIPIESGYVLYGGGYGHGIGMSQNGANGMAKAGYTYMDILQNFYQDITIENIYNGQNMESAGSTESTGSR